MFATHIPRIRYGTLPAFGFAGSVCAAAASNVPAPMDDASAAVVRECRQPPGRRPLAFT